MPLVSHDSRYRRLWMFPRNIRRIPPWKIMQIISLLNQQIRFSEWSGNQSLQDGFIKSLDQANLKRPSNLRDSNSGGARTYISQLQCLGFVYKSKQSLVMTLAGKDIDNSISPLEILQTQLLRHQYPSSYSLGQNVKIHPEIQVKPFLFILELLNDENVEFLTVEEMMIPVMYGHNDGCFSLCKEKILQLRNGQDVVSIINDLENDLFTPRTVGRTLEKALEDVRNIANTCKNYLQGACLINVIKEGRSEKVYFNRECNSIYLRELESKDHYIRTPQNTESFQRAYGAWNRIKDNTASTENEGSVSRGENIIKAHFMDYCGNNLVIDEVEPFIQMLRSNYGFDRDLVLEVIDPFLNRALSIFESSYLGLAIGGTSTATDFEKATGTLFEKKLGFDVQHTGQKHRSQGVGGYSDLFINDKEGHCAIIDTKASPSYNLSSSDYAKLVSNYIPNHTELLEGRALDLTFCSYIAGGFSGNIGTKLNQAMDDTGISVSCLSAKNLLEIASDDSICRDHEKVFDTFQLRKILEPNDFR